MLHSDLDDEQRAHLAHDYPTDVDSSLSSPSSAVPTIPDTRRRSKPASRHRSHTTADGSTSSSHLLARLVSREEEVREINAALVVTNERLEAESSRADAAERRALDYFHRLRIATENREHAEQESARLKEELRLYKLQLENAQKEIFRAQDIIDQVASQRNEAEAEAARARTKARKLQEEKLVMLAREEGRRMGYREGLSIGRRIGYDEGRSRRLPGPSDRLPHYPFPLEDLGRDESVREPDDGITDEERNDPRAHIQLRSGASIRQSPMRSESAPPVRTFESSIHTPPLPIPSRANPVRAQTPSRGHRTPSPPDEPDEPETIRPIPIRPSPVISSHRVNLPPPPDGWIPRADSRTSFIHVPPPYELHRLPTSPGSVATELPDGRPTRQTVPTPVPPPVRARDYAYQTSVPNHGQRAHVPSHTASLASRTSTHISQYDLVNKRPGSSLRNEIYARSGSQPSRESTSRNSHRDQDHHLSDRTEAESIVEQWRADSDVASSPRDPPRSFTPSAVPHPRRPPQFYYRPRGPTPLGDVDADRSRTPVQTGSTTARPRPRRQSPPGDSASQTTRNRSPFEYLRQRFRHRPSSGSTIPDIVVESPSEPEINLSPSATIAAHPEFLSPEAANRPLPQDDSHQHQHQHQHQHHHHPSQSQSQPRSQSQPQRHHHHRAPSSTYDTAPRSGTPSTPWPAGFMPYTPVSGRGADARPGPERDRRRARPDPDPVPNSNRTQHARTYAHPSSGYTRTRTQSASSSSMGRMGGIYEAAPLPPGVTYPAPPVRPHTSHRYDKDRGHERARDVVRDRDWGRERERDKDRDRNRNGRRDREQDLEDTGLDEELTRSPAPLQRPISLFDSDEA